MAATEQIFKQLLSLCAATDLGDYQRSGFAELCFPSYDHIDDEDGEALSWIPRVQIVDEPNLNVTTKFLLDAAQMHQIACFVLPKELAFHRWKRLFSLERDGKSFDRCMSRIKGEAQTLFIVKNSRDEIFGSFSDSPWETNNHEFHGGEQSRLFSFVKRDKRRSKRRIHVDNRRCNDASGGTGSHIIDHNDDVVKHDSSHSMEKVDSRDDLEERKEKVESVSVYSWTGHNRNFQYCDPSRTLIGFGGGGARFGLSIERDFQVGSTAPCETFGNEKLGSDQNFRVQDIEIWGFVAVEETCCSSILCFQPQRLPEEDINWIPPVRVDRDSHPETFIMDQPKMNQIARFVLPRTIASCRWKRVYSLSRDGDAFSSCLYLIRKEQRSLMVIRTQDGQIFGGYADSPWRPCNANYYGSAQACLWKFTSKSNNENNSATENANKIESVDPNQLKVFKWTGINRYIQYCDITHRILAFGGGGDSASFGLCVEKDFQRGSTGPCATFGNEALCNTEHFTIVDLEIWGFATGKF